MAYIPKSDSVVAFQSDPTKLVGTVSVIGTIGSSVIGHSPVVIIGGSVATATTNSSVQLLNSPNAIGSVATLQGTNPWIITGSVQTTVNTGNSSVEVLNFPTNQSVSGSVGASVIGTVPITQVTDPWVVTANDNSVIGVIQGSIAAAIVSGSVAVATGNSSVQVLNFPAIQDIAGSVVAFQGTDPWIITGSVQGSFSPAGNQSVSGTVGASIIGTVPVTGSFAVESASVVQQGTWRTSVISSTPSSMLVGASVFGNVGISGVPDVNTAGSVVAFQSNPSVLQVLAGLMSTNASIITAGGTTGNSSVQVLNFPTTQNVSGSVVGFQGTNPYIMTGSVQGTMSVLGHAPVVIVGGSVATASQPVSGSSVVQQGTWITSVISSTPSSMLVGASIIGLTPVNITNTNLDVAGSVVAFQGSGWSGSVAAVITNTNVNVSGSVVASGTVTVDQGVGFGSIASHIKSGSVIAVLGGNTSVISANPQSSVIALNSPIASWVSGVVDLRGNAGGSVAVIAGQGGAIKTYVTGVQVANYGPSSVLVTLAGSPAGGSILGYTIAPAGGGSNIVYPNALITGGNQPFTASINAVASVLVSAQGFTA